MMENVVNCFFAKRGKKKPKKTNSKYKIAFKFLGFVFLIKTWECSICFHVFIKILCKRQIMLGSLLLA